MLPNFIGLGAAKAGTTWLFRCLQEHPDVFVAARKETNFFDYQTIEGRLPEYEAHFVNASGYAAVGEVSIRYLNSTRAPARIQQHISRARLFVSLRNPVDQVYSHYWHLARQNFHEWGNSKLPRSFEEAIERYESALLGPAFYHKHLERWLQYFDRSQLHIIFYDDIKMRPDEVLTSLFEFIGVDSAFKPESGNENGASVRRGTSPRSPLLGRVHSYVYTKLNRGIYHPLKHVIGPRVAEQVKNTLRVRETMEAVFNRQGYPEMRQETRALLRNRFEEDIEELARLTGRDLSHWR